MATSNVPVTEAHGGGIGPEIMAASLRTVKEVGAHVDIEVGEKFICGRKATPRYRANRVIDCRNS